MFRDDITEALLEMHYHRAIVDRFASENGARFYRMLKPSTQREAWVGFDQGWVNTSIPNNQLYERLSEAVQSNGRQVGGFHFGYFLQFKVVHEMRRRSRFTPEFITAPYLRSELSILPNQSTELSQHETLLRLARIENAQVNYACPLFFDLNQIYENPDLATLKIVDVRSAPRGFNDGDRHFIVFQNQDDQNPSWCSEPVPAKSFSSTDWISNQAIRPKKLTTDNILELINSTKENLPRIDGESPIIKGVSRSWFPASFTILSFIPA